MAIQEPPIEYVIKELYLQNLWNGTFTQSSANAFVKDVGYNSILSVGGTQSFGFNISYTGMNNKPASFTLNGLPCQVQ